jgi:hypothetical protein
VQYGGDLGQLIEVIFTHEILTKVEGKYFAFETKWVITLEA